MREYVIKDPVKDGFKIGAAICADPINLARYQLAQRNFVAAMNRGDVAAMLRHLRETEECINKAINTLPEDN